MTHHYLLYNGREYGPFEDSDRMFLFLANRVMVEKPDGKQTWLTVDTEDEQENAHASDDTQSND